MYLNLFWTAVGVDSSDRRSIRQFSEKCGIPASRLRYYNESNTLPPEPDLASVCAAGDISKQSLMVRMMAVDRRLAQVLSRHADEIADLISRDPDLSPMAEVSKPEMVHRTEYGTLYQGDCIDLMRGMEEETVDVVFADPPFNLNKLYPSRIDDDLKELQYLTWCEEWMEECVRILKPGGSLFLWNIPKWNSPLSDFLNQRLTFRHWIATDIKYSLPIPGRFYPSHYSLLYYIKGQRPNTFTPDRLPMEICPHCKGDLKDYGGYKDKMNPRGVNLTDVWYDIPPVRHAKFKKRSDANELSIKLLDRIIEASSREGDVIFDPFGGAGTTYAVAEIKKRRWIGIEIGPVEPIIDRLSDLEDESNRLRDLRTRVNKLFSDKDRNKREELGLWTDESVKRDENRPGSSDLPAGVPEQNDQKVLPL